MTANYYFIDKNRRAVCIPYSVDNLHKMAEKFGFLSNWYEKNHKVGKPCYRIPMTKKVSAQINLVNEAEIERIILSGNPLERVEAEVLKRVWKCGVPTITIQDLKLNHSQLVIGNVLRKLSKIGLVEVVYINTYRNHYKITPKGVELASKL